MMCILKLNMVRDIPYIIKTSTISYLKGFFFLIRWIYEFGELNKN